MKLISLLVFIILITGCTQRVIILNETEINDYQGEPLSSINDFRENSIMGPQFVNIDNYTLQLTGLLAHPKNYTYNEVLGHQAYEKLVTLNCVEGWSVKLLWTGVLLKDLFDEAVLLPGVNTVIFYAYDGYSSSLPLNFILNYSIIMAYKINNVTLPSERGFPFQLVAEDKWGFKWVKWITKIELSNDSSYKGFWESRGYNNNADLNGSRFS